MSGGIANLRVLRLASVAQNEQFRRSYFITYTSSFERIMMIKTIVTMVVTAIAGLVGYLVSDSFRERLAQKQRDKIASEVARGDEAAVNARIGRFRSLVPWVVAALLIIGGCAVTRTVYVKEQDRVTALRPGEVYSNATDAVEWVVPRTVMTQLVIANEGL